MNLFILTFKFWCWCSCSGEWEWSYLRLLRVLLSMGFIGEVNIEFFPVTLRDEIFADCGNRSI